MGAIYIEYPTNLMTAFNQSYEDFEQEASLAMAAKLFELGKVTSLIRYCYLSWILEKLPSLP